MDNILDFLARCAKPKISSHGTEDDVAPLAPLEEILATCAEDDDLQIERIAGAGHFFDNKAGELMQAIELPVGDTATLRER